MGNRDYKNFSNGSIYHIYNRGNNREVIFRDEQDYRAFLFRLGLAIGIEKESLDKGELTRIIESRIRIGKLPVDGFKLHAFCLMQNHFHILIEQCGEVSISKFMLKVCTSFSRYINKKYDRVGHVFQDAFKSVIIESNPHLMLVSSYIHMNPVNDEIVKKPEDYKWSSYNDFAFDRINPILHKDFLIEVFGNKNNMIKEVDYMSSEREKKSKMSKVPFDIFDFW